MATKKEILERVENLAELTGLTKTNPESNFYLYAEYAAVYGGWRLIRVNKENGGHYGAFGQSSIETRLNTKEFYQYIKGLQIGLTYSNDIHLKS